MLRIEPLFGVSTKGFNRGRKVTRARTKRRRHQLQELWEAQGKHCYLCGQKMYPVSHTAKKTGWTADHVWPQSRGHSRVRNVLLAHASCNRDKKDRDPFACELLLLAAVNEKLTIWNSHRDSDGTATAAANEDLPVPQDCQARAEGIAKQDISP